MLIGRGADFATTLTSAERRHHRPVRRDALRRQRHRSTSTRASAATMGTFNAGTLERRPGHVPDHRARPGGRLRDGQRHARWRSPRSARATARTSSTSSSSAASRPARCTSPKSFFKAASLTPQTFNSFYIDNKHIAEYTSGLLPIRPTERRPRPADRWAPASTSGRASSRRTATSTAIDPERRHDRQLEQHHRPRLRRRRRQLGRQRLGRARRPAEPQPAAPQEQNGKWTPGVGDLGDERRRDPGRARDRHGAAAASACSRAPRRPNAAGGADARRCWSPGASTAAAAWTANLDGKIDDPGRGDHGRRLAEDRRRVHEAAARAAARRARTRCSRASTSRPAASTTAGTSTSTATSARCSASTWRSRSRTATAATAVKSACQQAIWNAIAAAGAELTAAQGTSDPAAWRADATAERIHFAPGLLPTTMRYTNRPSGIQQVISFNGHR